jgi:hypothetical protein
MYGHLPISKRRRRMRTKNNCSVKNIKKMRRKKEIKFFLLRIYKKEQKKENRIVTLRII